MSQLIWLRFLDNIFMIWNHSGRDFHVFISKINNFHEIIKFTYNYSNQEATFLDVNIRMKENRDLDTSVHEKVTNCHQYIEFSSRHPLSCKQGIRYSQDALRQITWAAPWQNQQMAWASSEDSDQLGRTCHFVGFIVSRLKSPWKIKEYEPPHDKTNKMTCAQRRRILVWASAHSDQSLRCPHEESLGP